MCLGNFFEHISLPKSSQVSYITGRYAVSDDDSAVAERLSLIVCFANCRQPEYGIHVLVTSVLLNFKNVFAGHRI